MKNSKIVLLLTLFIYSSTLFAQLEMSIHGGFHTSILNGDGWSNFLGNITDSKLGINFGAEIEMGLPVQNLTIVSGLNYRRDKYLSYVGTPITILGKKIPLGVSAETRLHHISAPLMIKYSYYLDRIAFFCSY